MTISVVTETYPPEVNGVAMTVGRIVQGMRDLGHRVYVVRPHQKNEPGPGETLGLPADLLVRGFPLPKYPDVRFGMPSGRRLKRHWQQLRPDLVHVVTEGPLGWSAVKAARQLGIPLTSGFHTNFDSYSAHYGLGWLRPVVAAYLRVLHRQTQITMVPTEALAASLAAEGLSGIRVVSRGVDTELFSPIRRNPELRTAWGGRPNAPICLYVGRLAPEKNLGLIEKTFQAIRLKQPEARMVWVGEGPDFSALKQRNPEHIFAGVRRGRELAEHYASADLFIFPSLTETYGNVVAEALASGVPVMAYRSAAAAELIDEGVHGSLVTPGDEAGFIEAGLRLADQRFRLPEMAENCRNLMLARNWEAVVKCFESVLMDAIKNH